LTNIVICVIISTQQNDYIKERGKNMKKYFYCYSWNFKEFLLDNDIQMIMYSKNTNTDKMFWVFENSLKITKLLDIWRSRKK
jgi:hypothetical protein